MVATLPPERRLSEGKTCDVNDYHVALMLRVKNGDVKSFELLVDIYQNKLISTITAMLGCPVEAEDLTQKVFIQVWRSASRYEPTAKFQTWLFAIAKNLVFNEMRRRKRKPVLSLTGREEGCRFNDVPALTISPVDSTLLMELEEEIEKAIGQLPRQQRFALLMRRTQEMPYEEIAIRLDTTIPCVKGLLFRARCQLKLRVAEYLKG